jgi:UPF0755 protein
MFAFALAVVLTGGWHLFFAAPANFTPGTVVTIARGTPLPAIASELSESHVIRYPSLLRLALRATGASASVQTGVYRFAAPEDLFTVAHRLAAGDYGLPPVRITFIEGVTMAEAAAEVASAFPNLSADGFASVAAPEAGYLFPDTYLFQPSDDASTIVARMRANFDKKVAPLLGAVNTSGHSLADIVAMASIIEKEAATDTDRHIISGILWHRLAIGMPLQVDAARETYSHPGLPEVPICNPGLDAIEAALEPTKTAYLYYLTGRDGLMHYATTYAGHQANLQKYLR